MKNIGDFHLTSLDKRHRCWTLATQTAAFSKKAYEKGEADGNVPICLFSFLLLQLHLSADIISKPGSSLLVCVENEGCLVLGKVSLGKYFGE